LVKDNLEKASLHEVIMATKEQEEEERLMKFVDKAQKTNRKIEQL
jgi:hypothetical protein